MYTLTETELVKVVTLNNSESQGQFVIEPLLPGFGVTIGNALRRVLLSSLDGSAITSVRIEGATHEFTTIKGVREDIVDILLNLKGVRMRLEGAEPLTISLQAKGPGAVTVKEFNPNPRIKFVDPKYVICNLERGGTMNLEITVERGRGYVPTERRAGQKPPIGVIAIDSIFTPMKKVHFEVEHTRVEGMTNFDRLTLDIETDGTITPIEAMDTALKILMDHFLVVENHFKSVPVIPKKESKTSVKKSTKAIKATDIGKQVPSLSEDLNGQIPNPNKSESKTATDAKSQPKK